MLRILRFLLRIPKPEVSRAQGAAIRGLDFAAFTRTAEGVELVLVESKSTAGLVNPGRFTSLGLGRGGSAVWSTNLSAVERAIQTQVQDKALSEALLSALRSGAPIRLAGPPGFRVTGRTLTLIESTTGRTASVVIVP